MDASAWGRFARSMAKAFEDLADELTAAVPEPDHDLETEPSLPIDAGRRLGPRQLAILELPGLADDGGMKTAEIADAIKYEVPNTYMTLRALSGLIEQIPGITPQRWRLTSRFRPTAAPYLKIATHVHRGEWTTYGDISIAHRGDTRAARAVGRAAATLQDFPHPQRVLAGGGAIPEGWRDRDGNGPEECRRRLEAEDVSFTDEGRADPASRVTWDVLIARASADM